jgi:integrative and conjugative element protein (TIGR02256 family)
MLEQEFNSANPTFLRPINGRFYIIPEAFETMLGFLQDEPHRHESGGVLLGRHILNTNDIVVDRVTIPMPGDHQRRTRFHRARLLHQEQIDLAWKESKGTCTYLGEWHTHPEPIPTPSFVDEIDWRRKLMVDQFSTCLFFLILGTQSISAWEGNYRKVTLHPLRRINSNVLHHDPE